MNKVEIDHLCKGCMSYLPYPNMPCPTCSFDISKYYSGRECMRIGRIINKRYLVGKVIEQTNFEFHYIGWDFGLNCKVIIREYYPKDYFDRDNNNNNMIRMTARQPKEAEKFLKLYYNEAEALALLGKLDGIVGATNVFYENGTCYVVNDYFDYISLEEYMKMYKGKFTIERILYMLKPVIYSLATVHQNGIIHGHISERTLVVDSGGNLLLTGFGIQEYTKFQATYLNDMQDICNIIYYVLCGSKYHNNILTFNKTGEVIFPEDAPAFIKRVIYACINKDPSKMCSNMFELYNMIYNDSYYKNIIVPKFYNYGNKEQEELQDVTPPEVISIDPTPIKRALFDLTIKDMISLLGIGFCAFIVFFSCRLIIDMKLNDKRNIGYSAAASQQEPIKWFDKNFETAIREYLNITKEDIYANDLNNITIISLDNKDIVSIDDIKNFRDLETVSLKNNKIVDLSPLEFLDNLKKIDLSNNMITDTSPLVRIISLEKVDLSNNPVKDWSGTANIKELKK